MRRPSVEKAAITTRAMIPKNGSGFRSEPNSAPTVASSKIPSETTWTTRANRALRLVEALM
jgi:hypothetical protein